MPNPVSTALPNPSSYDLGTPGVVIDRVTGLMWQQPIETSTSYGVNGSVASTLGIIYCQNLVLAGHSDWRLPTLIELISIVDTTHINPAFDPIAFPGALSLPPNFLTSTHIPGATANNYFVVFFGNGSIGAGIGSTDGYARCVR